MAIQIASLSRLLVSIIVIVCMLFPGFGNASDTTDEKVFVVYMGELPKEELLSASSSSLHTTMLQQVIGSRASESLIHSYSRSFHGFSAKLTHEEAQMLAEMEGVVSVFPSKRLELHTTRSWDFLGFPQSIQRRDTESDIVIGMLDTGIWPESESFSDLGFGPPPTKWKGTCQSNFTCNNKIIGARYYRHNTTLPPGDIASPRDSEGHGSHTSSTAAGNLVTQANLFGLGLGTARGGVPSARIATYKVCWSDGCYDADILAAFDDAIADGVDIISISVGASKPRNYFEDGIAIGSFHAMKKGILTSTSAGNSGPQPASTANIAPWVLSVAASIIDRKFSTKAVLGNGATYEGISINTFTPGREMYPIIYAGHAPNITNGFNLTETRACKANSLNRSLVQGKIVVCDSLGSGRAALTAGAVGVIMQDSGYKDAAFSFPLPATYLDTTAGSNISAYLNSTTTPKATIFKSTEVKAELAFAVVSFSSRGPNAITSDILKPDLSAPGVEILAAWSPSSTVTPVPGDPRHVNFNIVSGTSMACPHASAVAAYVKSFHPTWSPAAIKSALMTTATPMSPLTNTEVEFAYGSGQINPLKALNPGLVYDTKETDYVNFLCAQGYNITNLRLVTGDESSCTNTTKTTVWDLNYPSFTLSTKSKNSSVTRVFHRTITNVGTLASTYKSIVNAPEGLKIVVKPQVLTFRSLLQKQTFTVMVEASLNASTLSGSLVWDDGFHQVRSPIVAFIVPDSQKSS